jgi:hypothetical protein
MFHNKEDLMVGSVQTKAVRTHLRSTNLWAQLQVRFQADQCKNILFHQSSSRTHAICNMLISQTPKHAWQSLKPKKFAQAVTL